MCFLGDVQFILSLGTGDSNIHKIQGPPSRCSTSRPMFLSLDYTLESSVELVKARDARPFPELLDKYVFVEKGGAESEHIYLPIGL